MNMSIDFKEYTRLRDIVHKRNARLAQAGLASLVHFPTVKEIKAGYVSPTEAFKAIKGYYSGGSTVKAVRQTGLVPEFKSFPVMPPIKKLSESEKKSKKKEQEKEYRRRKAVKDLTDDPKKKAKYESYLKALKTMSYKMKKAGLDLGIDLNSLTPKEAQAFVEYIEYRFSQADFDQKYVIDQFIEGFAKRYKEGYKPAEILKDFDKFALQHEELIKRSEDMKGLDPESAMSIWDKFFGID